MFELPGGRDEEPDRIAVTGWTGGISSGDGTDCSRSSKRGGDVSAVVAIESLCNCPRRLAEATAAVDLAETEDL